MGAPGRLETTHTVMPLLERRVRNGEALLHVCFTKRPFPSRHLPVLFIPGMGAAKQFEADLQRFQERACATLSIRGRGQSVAPESANFSFAAQASDCQAVTQALEWPSYVVAAYSVGVAFALQHALNNPQQVRGLVLMDYPAHYPKREVSWIERWRERNPLATAIARDASEESLWWRLPEIRCPVLLVRGGQEGAMLSEKDAERYLDLLPNATLVTLPEADHNLLFPDPEPLYRTLREFFAQLDESVASPALDL